MSELERPEMSDGDIQINSLYKVIAGRGVARNLTGGYLYAGSLVGPLDTLSGLLEERYGLTKLEVFDRVRVASELAVVVQEHARTYLPEDPSRIYN